MTKPKFIDLFAGCGGMTLGLMKAGWQGLFAIEKNPMAFETISANFLSLSAELNGTKLDWPDSLPKRAIALEELLSGEFREQLDQIAGNLDLVSGGPPCQGFSFSGRRNHDDARNALVEAYAKFVIHTRPRLLLIENVPGILTPHGKKQRAIANPQGLGRPPKSYAEKLSEHLKEMYIFRNGLIDAAFFGVPQRRKRFFGVGLLRSAFPAELEVVNNRVCMSRNGVFEPKPEFDLFELLQKNRIAFLVRHGLDPKRETTTREAIGDFTPSDREVVRDCVDPQSPQGFSELNYIPPKLDQANAYIRLMREGLNGHVPDSLRLARHSDEIRIRFEGILKSCPRGVRLDESHRSQYSTTLKHRIVPLAADKPSHTLTTLPDDLIHYCRPRTLTVRESARLQSFPDWFVFRGKYTTGGSRRRLECPRFTQVGNAVPPLLAEAWGESLKSMLSMAVR